MKKLTKELAGALDFPAFLRKEKLSVTDVTSFSYCPWLLFTKKKTNKKAKFSQTPASQKGTLLHKMHEKLINLANKLRNSECISDNQKYEKLQEKATEMLENSEIWSNLPKDVKKETENLIKSIVMEAHTISLNHENIVIKTEEYLFDEKLNLAGKVDRTEFFGKQIYPTEIKSRRFPTWRDILQLGGYALLLERKYKKEVVAGYVWLLGSNFKVPVSAEKAKYGFLKILTRMRHFSKMPEIPRNRCETCFLREKCLKQNGGDWCEKTN